MAQPHRVPAELAARLRAEADRELSAEEWRRSLDAPISEEEREQALELISWFRRRYSTPLERLAYVRQAYRRWSGMLDRASKSSWK